VLYFFTWDSDFLIKQEVKKWKDRFISKYGDFNLLVIKDFYKLSNNFVSENILSGSFLWEKKLVIIEWLFDYLYVKVDENVGNEDFRSDHTAKPANDNLEFFLSVFQKIPEENIVLIVEKSPDKRSKIYKEILKIAEVKEYNLKTDDDIKAFLLNKYNWKISSSALWKIVSFKSWDMYKSTQEIEKLLITKDFVDEVDVVNHIMPELEESIFIFVDKVLAKDFRTLFDDLDIILNYTNIYAFYNNFIANMRFYMYVSLLKNLWLSDKKIISDLNVWNRAFLLQKKYKLSSESLTNFYLELINFDKNMKFWKLIWSSDVDLKFELQKILTKI